MLMPNRVSLPRLQCRAIGEARFADVLLLTRGDRKVGNLGEQSHSAVEYSFVLVLRLLDSSREE